MCVAARGRQGRDGPPHAEHRVLPVAVFLADLLPVPEPEVVLGAGGDGAAEGHPEELGAAGRVPPLRHRHRLLRQARAHGLRTLRGARRRAAPRCRHSCPCGHRHHRSNGCACDA